MYLFAVISDATSFHKFCGLVASAGGVVAGNAALAAGTVTSVLPPWAASAKEWLSFGAIAGGCFGTLIYSLSLLFDVQKKWHDAREKQRQELREIHEKREEAMCQLRQLEGRCPLMPAQSSLDAPPSESHAYDGNGDIK